MVSDRCMQQCYCCDKLQGETVEVSFIADGVHLCSDCEAQIKRPTIRQRTVATTNPALRKFELEVANGKRDIGLIVVIEDDDAIHVGIRKLRAETSY